MKKMQVLTEQEISDFMDREKHAAANHHCSHLTHVSPERARISYPAPLQHNRLEKSKTKPWKCAGALSNFLDRNKHVAENLAHFFFIHCACYVGSSSSDSTEHEGRNCTNLSENSFCYTFQV
jgi:hypothetical protein